MIEAIWERAISGGDKAIAAPRGDGKSQIVICTAVMALLGTSTQFPVLIGNTMVKGRKLFQQFRNKFENASLYPEFHGDFPEITACVDGLEGAPQRAAKQHVDGQRTFITWSQHLIVMPTVPPQSWGTTHWGGKRLTFFGLDSAIRGEGFEHMRPDLAIIDDPETREVAFSPTDRHEDIEQMIDGDVAGLSGPDTKIPRVVLTTIQNPDCYSFRVTDKHLKPSFDGERYAQLVEWPTHRELWDEYISLRQKDQAGGKKDGPTATQFYRDNFDDMNAGAVIANPYRHVKETNKDGDVIELDALAAFFNRVADWGLDAVLAELQQQPANHSEVDNHKLTAGLVQRRMSGLARGKLPKTDQYKITVGLDIGKYYSHWTKLVTHGNAISHIVDYGIMETPGLSATSDEMSIETAILKSLEAWRIDIQSENPPDMVLIDSGDYSNAVYAFVRQYGSPFNASKGHGGSKLHFEGKDSETRRQFERARADYQSAAGVWLFNFDSEYWKHQVQQRLLTETINQQNQLTDGALSLWSTSDAKEHLSFSHHLVAEERREQFIPGKGLVSKWAVVNRNNHWLDATALALLGSSLQGYKVIPKPEPNQLQSYNPQQSQQSKQPAQPQNRFRQRPGGWIQGVRRR
jgi:hypothetical protein